MDVGQFTRHPVIFSARLRPLSAAYWVKVIKVKALYILPWIAASTNEVGFHVGPV